MEITKDVKVSIIKLNPQHKEQFYLYPIEAQEKLIESVELICWNGIVPLWQSVLDYIHENKLKAQYARYNLLLSSIRGSFVECREQCLLFIDWLQLNIIKI